MIQYYVGEKGNFVLIAERSKGSTMVTTDLSKYSLDREVYSSTGDKLIEWGYIEDIIEMVKGEDKILNLQVPQGSFVLYPSMSKEGSLESFNEWFKSTYKEESPLGMNFENIMEKFRDVNMLPPKEVADKTSQKSYNFSIQEWCDKVNEKLGFKWVEPKRKYMTTKEAEAQEYFREEMKRLGLIPIEELKRQSEATDLPEDTMTVAKLITLEHSDSRKWWEKFLNIITFGKSYKRNLSKGLRVAVNNFKKEMGYE